MSKRGEMQIGGGDDPGKKAPMGKPEAMLLRKGIWGPSGYSDETTHGHEHGFPHGKSLPPGKEIRCFGFSVHANLSTLSYG